MSQHKTLEEIVVEQADVVRHQIEEAADFAESEMDLQIEVAKALDHFSSVAHLPKLRAHHNITIGEGNRIREYAAEHTIPKHELRQKILSKVVGFDLNPLAVMASRTNYLLALRDMLKLGGEIEIPVYLCDSIMTPAEYGELFTAEGRAATGSLGRVHELPTSAARFMIPTEIAQSREVVAVYTEELERCTRGDYSEEEFIHRLRSAQVPVESEPEHKALFRQVKKLRREGRNDVWARIIKNQFAPLFIERVNFVIGNPPWIRWGYLPEEYRQRTVHLWKHYGLFSLKARQAQLGSGEKDFSQLFTYACIDRYLEPGGLLGFLITRTVFKAGGQAEGFRRFRIGDAEEIRVTNVDDLSDVKPFEGATNLTALLACRKGQGTQYPVPWVEWKKKKPQEPYSDNAPLTEVRRKLRQKEMLAGPVGEPASPWRTYEKGGAANASILGKGAYTAQRGAGTDPYGVYQLEVLGRGPRVALVRIKNAVGATMKTQIRQIETVVEEDLVYPMLRGSDIHSWLAKPDLHVLLAQDPAARMAIELKQMKLHFPEALAYLKRFEAPLRNRKSRFVRGLMERSAFYAMYGISQQTLAAHKVVWRRMGNRLEAAVVGLWSSGVLKSKPVVPADTVAFIPCGTAEEAHFLCAVINSAPLKAALYSFSAGGRGLAPPAVLKRFAIPRFNPKERIHQTLMMLSQQAHRLKAKDVESKRIHEVEGEIDRAAAELWGIKPRDLAENIREAARR